MDIDFSTVQPLLAAYGYPFLVAFVLLASAGAPLPVGVVLIALGALSAHTGGPNIVTLAVLGTAASVTGDLFDYGLGRAGTPLLIRWAPWLQHLGERLGGKSSRLRALHLWNGYGPGLVVLITRFLLTPIATPISLLAGASRFRFATFLLWDALGEAIYVLLNLALGRLWGANVSSEDIVPLSLAFGLMLSVGIALIVHFGGKLWARVAQARALAPASVQALPALDDALTPGEGPEPHSTDIPSVLPFDGLPPGDDPNLQHSFR